MQLHRRIGESGCPRLPSLDTNFRDSPRYVGSSVCSIHDVPKSTGSLFRARARIRQVT